MFIVRLNDLEFYGYHGAADEEQVIGHRFRAHVEMKVDGSADDTDEIGGTVNYGVVAAEILQCSADVKVRTIERLARLMGEKIMQQHPEVVVATIRLEKLLPPSPQIFRSAEVELTLERIRGIEGAGTYR